MEPTERLLDVYEHIQEVYKNVEHVQLQWKTCIEKGLSIIKNLCSYLEQLDCITNVDSEFHPFGKDTEVVKERVCNKIRQRISEEMHEINNALSILESLVAQLKPLMRKCENRWKKHFKSFDVDLFETLSLNNCPSVDTLISWLELVYSHFYYEYIKRKALFEEIEYDGISSQLLKEWSNKSIDLEFEGAVMQMKVFSRINLNEINEISI